MARSQNDWARTKSFERFGVHARVLAGAGVPLEPCEQAGAVGLGGRRGIADAFALGARRGGEPLRGDAAVRRPIDVERQHRQAMHAGEMEQRQVEFAREAPDSRPVDLAEEGGLVEFALRPAVENGLDPPREHLEAEDHIGSPAEQPRDRVKLPAMVLRLDVQLAEQHDCARGERRERVVSFLAACGIDPAAYRRAAAGRRGAAVEPFARARRHEARGRQER